MSIEVSFDKNRLFVNNHCVDFIHSIRDAKSVAGSIIVLLEIPTNDDTIDNLYSVNGDGKINWQSQSIKEMFSTEKLLPYEQMIAGDKEIRVSDFYGRCYYFNVENGKFIKRDITK